MKIRVSCQRSPTRRYAAHAMSTLFFTTSAVACHVMFLHTAELSCRARTVVLVSASAPAFAGTSPHERE